MYLDNLHPMAHQPSATAKRLAAHRKEVKLEARRTRGRNGTKQEHGGIIMHRARAKEIEKLIRHRYNGGPCDTHDDVWLDAILPSLQRTAGAWAWAKMWVPLVARERGEEWFQSRMQKRLRWPSVDELAQMLRITDEEAKDLGLKVMVSMTRPEAVRKAEQKAKDAERQRKKRLANGATPRCESIKQQEPWKKEGISKSTYYRRQNKLQATGETNSSESLNPCIGGTDEPVSSIPDMSGCKERTSRSRFPGGLEASTSP
jgi:hypothetical protein